MRRGRKVSDPEIQILPPGIATQIGERGVIPLQHRLKLLCHGEPQRGGLDAAGLPLQEGRSDLRLEGLHLTGERRLGDVQSGRGPIQTALAQDDEKGTEELKHRPMGIRTPYIGNTIQTIPGGTTPRQALSCRIQPTSIQRKIQNSIFKP